MKLITLAKGSHPKSLRGAWKRAWFVALVTVGLVLPVRGETLYRVGVEDVQYYPLQDFTADDKHGIMAEILRAFAAQAGVKLEFIPLPIHRFNSWYDEKAIDFRVPDHPDWTAGAQPNLHYSKPMVELCKTTVVLAKNKNMAMGSFTRIGILNGFTPSHSWHSKIANGEVKLIRDASVKVLARMLINEMVDGLDVDIHVARHQVKGLGMSEDAIAVSSAVPPSMISYRMSTIEHPAVLSAFDDFLSKNTLLLDQIAKAHDFGAQEACADMPAQSSL